MGNVCARCDRTDCPTLLQRPEPYQWEPRDSCYVSPAWKEWRDVVESAASDCRNHVVDWRAEALTLRALLREAQPIVEAVATQAREAIRRSDDSAWDEAALATDEAGLSSPDLMRRIDAALKGQP